ncbi:hypothetical protein IQ07DRAFT_468514, partial [Pyrenochaeta sp. DS3sAY3a]
LDERPTYVALSYTWGDAKRRETIVEEDGKEYKLSVGESLYEALSSIFPVYAILWAEAICKIGINQKDEEEKVGQIQEMWHTYHQASYVAAWLGMSADNSDELLEKIAELGRQ